MILFLGAPGTGKGTQSSWLSSELGMPCLSTGEILRTEAKRNTPAGFRLRRTLAEGAMVSDATVCSVVAERLRRDMPENGIILDGFPRNVEQARCLEAMLREIGLSQPTVIHLEVSVDGLLRRLTARRQCAKCGSIYNLVSKPSKRGPRCELDGAALVQRDDDSESVILKRMDDFDRACAPLVEFYADGDYHAIDGDRDPREISEQLLEIVAGERAMAAA